MNIGQKIFKYFYARYALVWQATPSFLEGSGVHSHIFGSLPLEGPYYMCIANGSCVFLGFFFGGGGGGVKYCSMRICRAHTYAQIVLY